MHSLVIDLSFPRGDPDNFTRVVDLGKEKSGLSPDSGDPGDPGESGDNLARVVNLAELIQAI